VLNNSMGEWDEVNAGDVEKLLQMRVLLVEMIKEEEQYQSTLEGPKTENIGTRLEEKAKLLSQQLESLIGEGEDLSCGLNELSSALCESSEALAEVGSGTKLKPSSTPEGVPISELQKLSSVLGGAGKVEFALREDLSVLSSVITQLEKGNDAGERLEPQQNGIHEREPSEPNKELAEANKQIQQLKREKYVLEQKLKVLNVKRRKSKEFCNKAKDRISKMKQSLEKRQTEVADLQAEVERQTSMRKKLVEKTKKEIEVILSEEYKKASEKVEKARDNVDKIKVKNNELKKRNDALKSAFREQELENMELEQQRERVTKKLVKRSLELKKREEVIISQEEEIAQLKLFSSDLQEQLEKQSSLYKPEEKETILDEKETQQLEKETEAPIGDEKQEMTTVASGQDLKTHENNEEKEIKEDEKPSEKSKEQMTETFEKDIDAEEGEEKKAISENKKFKGKEKETLAEKIPGKIQKIDKFTDFSSHLPDELLTIVFAHLTLAEILICESVCKRWNTLSGSNVIWERLCSGMWPKKEQPTAGWRLTFKSKACRCKNINCVIMGDASSGKKTLITAFQSLVTQNGWNRGEETDRCIVFVDKLFGYPVMFNLISVPPSSEGLSVEFMTTLDKINAQKEKITGVVVCIDLVKQYHKFSSGNVLEQSDLTKWSILLNQYIPGIPLLLVGTKADLGKQASDFICNKIAQINQKELNFSQFLTCSSMSNRGLVELFDEVQKLKEGTRSRRLEAKQTKPTSTAEAARRTKSGPSSAPVPGRASSFLNFRNSTSYSPPNEKKRDCVLQ